MHQVVLGDGKEREPQATVEQRALLRRAAAQSIVLLRNEGNILPLDVTKIKKVTVIGPNAKQRLITGGGSNEVTPIFVVSPLEGIEQAFGKDNVTFVEGCRCTFTEFFLRNDIANPMTAARHADRLNYDLITPDGEDGWRLEFYNHDAVDQNLPLFDEEPVLVVPALAQTQIKIFAMQVLGLTEQFSVKFKAFLKPQDFSGEWDFSLIVVGRAKLWIDGQLVVDLWDGQKMGEMFGYQATEEVSGRFYVEQGKTYELEVLYNNISPLRGYAPAISRAIRLGGWPVVNEDEDLKAAEKAAAEADVAIVVVGLNQDWESEGHDRKTMDLPARSNELITRVSRANPRTIIVNQSVRSTYVLRAFHPLTCLLGIRCHHALGRPGSCDPADLVRWQQRRRRPRRCSHWPRQSLRQAQLDLPSQGRGHSQPRSFRKQAWPGALRRGPVGWLQALHRP